MKGKKRWIAIVLLAVAWAVAGTSAARWRERAEAAEAWAAAVEQEAQMILADRSR